MALTLLAERRKPSGECLINAATPEGSRPAATRIQSEMRAMGLMAPCRSQVGRLREVKVRKKSHDACTQAHSFFPDELNAKFESSVGVAQRVSTAEFHLP